MYIMIGIDSYFLFLVKYNPPGFAKPSWILENPVRKKKYFEEI